MLHCCFVDYREAFDNINRTLLSRKLDRLGVCGKMYSVITSLYTNVKSCVKFMNNISEAFNVDTGVLQGIKTLSPMLFTLYLNYSENEFIVKDVSQ